MEKNNGVVSVKEELKQTINVLKNKKLGNAELSETLINSLQSSVDVLDKNPTEIPQESLQELSDVLKQYRDKINKI